MNEASHPQWLKWAREIQAIGQTGLHYAEQEYDRQRYGRLVSLASEIMAAHSQAEAASLERIFLQQNGYATPKVDVRGAVFRDDKLLMVRERTDGYWSLPGGWADVNEKPSAMIEREIREESGFHARARCLVGVYEANHDQEPIDVFHAYKLLFLCDIVAGEAQTSYETSEVGFFTLDDLPPLSTSRTQMRYIRDAQACLRDMTLPAVFD
ncbi:MAG TPA: NUDIX hydrolase [Anaerolineaceae bacterium]|nr:NUDIX hydrolase [Anaerolineaceae bacterium]HPN50563.1 NUDIX hydrolase [Anaerolineaceae bacterium]